MVLTGVVRIALNLLAFLLTLQEYFQFTVYSLEPGILQIMYLELIHLVEEHFCSAKCVLQFNIISMKVMLKGFQKAVSICFILT